MNARRLLGLVGTLAVGLAIIVYVVAMLVLLMPPAYAADAYADAVRAAALGKRLHLERCQVERDVAACRARAEAAWARAMILAEARRAGTKAAWAEAQRELARIDARGER